MVYDKEYRYCNICKGGPYPYGKGLCDCNIGPLPDRYFTIIDGWKAEAISRIEEIYGGRMEEKDLPATVRVVEAIADTYAEWVDQELSRPYMLALGITESEAEK